MDLNRRYIDNDGSECDILQLVKKNPEWAASLIQEVERGGMLHIIDLTEKFMTENKLSEAINIIKELIKNSPTIASECGGDLSCFFCYKDHNQRKTHDKTCPYVKAKEFIRRNK